MKISLKKQAKNSYRFWEIDFLRGVAIIMMIIFHLIYDLSYFGAYNIDTSHGFWGVFGKFTFITFLLLVGISLNLSASRRKREGAFSFKVYLKRGIKIFLWGMIITLATYIFIPESYVKFGILHLIGVSIILTFPLLNFKCINLGLGSFVILFGLFLKTMTFDTTWLFWLGLTPHTFSAIDHFPIFPYWGIILIGLFLSKILYNNFVRSFTVPKIENHIFIKPISYLGRHSLLIYLIHQPLLIFLIHVV